MNGTSQDVFAGQLAVRERIRTLHAVQAPLKDGRTLTIQWVGTEAANAVHRATSLAFAEYRGKLDPPNGSDLETVEMVSDQIAGGLGVTATIDGECVGSLRFSLQPDHLHVGRVGVIPAERGIGIGRKLMIFAEMMAKHLGYTEIRLGTRAKLVSNIRFYQSLEYIIVEELQHPRGVDRIVLMTKFVDGATDQGV